MTFDHAIADRIRGICKSKGISVSRLCLLSGVLPSTVYEFLAGRTKSPTVATIKMLCDGVNMSLADFFRDDYFSDVSSVTKS